MFGAKKLSFWPVLAFDMASSVSFFFSSQEAFDLKWEMWDSFFHLNALEATARLLIDLI